ncbi:hypothetical protein CYMTET_7257 [Cymbomonas tetramitiformis]|uniref:Rubisco LSMT substrate-binding domain-containing protein n=1 Tax=Cymbomonas tetramitiformis TaxID=36881 RepID=A0AAE0LHM8_9CHLO|nr:hypothetical protein CYMTET_7257 [Cymbomonas tetramitiformis]
MLRFTWFPKMIPTLFSNILIFLVISHASAQNSYAGSGLTDDLVGWIGSLPNPGAINSKLLSEDFATMGAGFKAKSDIGENETLVEIPLDAAMSSKTAGDSAIGEVFEGRKFNDFQALVLHLMYEESDPKSKYSAFIQTLPESVDLPFTWNDEALEALNGSRLNDYVLTQRGYINKDYEELFAPVFESDPVKFPKELFNKEKYVWALSIVLSRAHRFSVPGRQGTIPVLIPVLDIFNHDNVGGRVESDSEKGVFRLSATRAYKEGEQVYASYGQSMGNFELLYNYGFVLPANPEDAISVNFKVFDDAFAEIRKSMLKALKLPQQASYLVKKGQALPSDLLKTLRVQVLRAADFDKFPLVAEGPVSLQNELETLHQLLGTFKALLNRYPNSATQDTELLMSEGGLERKLAYSVFYRRAEKTIVEDGIKNIFELWNSLLLAKFTEKAAPAIF